MELAVNEVILLLAIYHLHKNIPVPWRVCIGYTLQGLPSPQVNVYIIFFLHTPCINHLTDSRLECNLIQYNAPIYHQNYRVVQINQKPMGVFVQLVGLTTIIISSLPSLSLCPLQYRES